MNYDKDSRPNGVDTITGEVLAEAMPWIKNITGKTIVIKYGGSAMVDEQLRAEVMADIVLLKIIGVNPVIVHGGGLAISEAMKRFDMPVKFIDGQRVTTDAAMKVVRSVLAGQVNQELVEAMNEHGRVAVGLSGADGATIIAEQASSSGASGASCASTRSFWKTSCRRTTFPFSRRSASGKSRAAAFST